ncbi:MAG: DNA-methyltransferase, partial [Thermus sp.]|uniref:DNA-methyltransferase n=1 Tax=Thermus sp. TaxID=275 RepID=UPI00391D687A
QTQGSGGGEGNIRAGGGGYQGCPFREVKMAKKKGTSTRTFGSGNREGHDSKSFYGRALFAGKKDEQAIRKQTPKRPPEDAPYLNAIFLATSERMEHIPDETVHLAFTSPPYNVGKDYDLDLSLEEYKAFIGRVGAEVYRTLVPGGRYVINVANVGRNPYIPYTALFWQVHMEIGFIPMGEIIWVKGKGANGNCAWGSWKSAKAPRIRDIHEYLLVMAKESTKRPDKGESTITDEEFLRSTLSVWEIPPESAKRVGHPAPFPLELAERVIQLFSYRGDLVLDPFAGSGTTLVAAAKLGRKYVGYEIVEEYVRLAEKRLKSLVKPQPSIFEEEIVLR